MFFRKRVRSMPMVVTNYLAQFCHLVRDRVIPKSEVHRLIDKYSLSQDLLEVFERILSSAREAAESISKDEKSARASSWILIAGFSHLDEDIKMAIACANDLGNDDMESQILMSLVKTLVNAGKIKQAWQIAFKIRKDYWRTEAILAIASKTRLSEDFARARGSAKYIMDDSKHNDVLDEIVRVEKGESVPWLSDEEGNPHYRISAVKELVKSLVRLREFQEAHEAALRVSGVGARIEVLAAIGHSLKQLIK